MKLLRSYDDGNPIILDRALKYGVVPGYTIPKKYLMRHTQKEEVLNKHLLKKELDFIIEKTPLKLKPFRPNIQFCIAYAQVTEFRGPDRAAIPEAIPRGIKLGANDNLEMIELDLEAEKVWYFRTFPHKALISFEIGENKLGFNERDLFEVSVERFLP